MPSRIPTAIIRGARSAVAVNLRTGKLAASTQPKLVFEELPPKRQLGLSLEDSLLRIEDALASGTMQLTPSVKRDMRRMYESLALQDRLLDEAER